MPLVDLYRSVWHAMAQRKDMNMDALREAARAAYLKKRADETERVHKALLKEDARDVERGVLGGADAARVKADIERRQAQQQIVADLSSAAGQREALLGGSLVDSIGADAATAEIAQARYAGQQKSSKHAADDTSAAQQQQQQNQQQPTGHDAPKREINLIVSQANIEARVQTGDYVEAKTEGQIRAERTAALDAKRQLIKLQREGLPVTKARKELVSAIAANQVVVVVGETGSGKTTQIPQFLLEEGYSKVACTQPRRLAAISVAERVAVEMNVRCGHKVGYCVRFDDKRSQHTEIEFLTDGMMLKEIMREADLASYQAIMIDEAHERSIATDILLGFLRDLIRARKDLKIIVASATIEADKFARFFGEAPLVRVSGRTFPVTTKFLPEPEEDYAQAAAVAALQTHLDEPLPGDVLVFLPGQEDIERCVEIITEAIAGMPTGTVRPVVVLPLFSTLPPDQQKRIYDPAPPNARKIIVSTNIAETSITVDGIVYVIDTGLCKQKFFNPRTSMECLAVVPISRASAEQRKGRAGRTQAGQCLRLYTKFMYENELEKDPPPEILRSSLTSIVLNLKALGIHNPLAFDFIDAPSAEALARSLDLLLMLGAVTRRGDLSKTGRRMAELPVEPPLAKALIKSQEAYGCAKQFCIAAAMLSLQNSVFVGAKDLKHIVDGVKREFFANTTGDVVGYVNLFREWEEKQRSSQQWSSSNAINHNAMLRARDVRNQLLNNLHNMFADEITDERDPLKISTAITKSMLSGYFMNVAKLGLDDRSFIVAKTHVEALLHPSGCLGPLMFIDRRLFEEQQRQLRAGGSVDPKTFVPKYVNVVHGEKPQLVMFAELRQLKERAYLVHCCAVDREWVQEAAPGFFKDADLSNDVGGARKRLR